MFENSINIQTMKGFHHEIGSILCLIHRKCMNSLEKNNYHFFYLLNILTTAKPSVRTLFIRFFRLCICINNMIINLSIQKYNLFISNIFNQ